MSGAGRKLGVALEPARLKRQVRVTEGKGELATLTTPASAPLSPALVLRGSFHPCVTRRKPARRGLLLENPYSEMAGWKSYEAARSRFLGGRLHPWEGLI